MVRQSRTSQAAGKQPSTADQARLYKQMLAAEGGQQQQQLSPKGQARPRAGDDDDSGAKKKKTGTYAGHEFSRKVVKVNGRDKRKKLTPENCSFRHDLLRLNQEVAAAEKSGVAHQFSSEYLQALNSILVNSILRVGELAFADGKRVVKVVGKKGSKNAGKPTGATKVSTTLTQLDFYNAAALMFGSGSRRLENGKSVNGLKETEMYTLAMDAANERMGEYKAVMKDKTRKAFEYTDKSQGRKNAIIDSSMVAHVGDDFEGHHSLRAGDYFEKGGKLFRVKSGTIGPKAVTATKKNGYWEVDAKDSIYGRGGRGQGRNPKTKGRSTKVITGLHISPGKVKRLLKADIPGLRIGMPVCIGIATLGEYLVTEVSQLSIRDAGENGHTRVSVRNLGHSVAPDRSLGAVIMPRSSRQSVGSAMLGGFFPQAVNPALSGMRKKKGRGGG